MHGPTPAKFREAGQKGKNKVKILNYKWAVLFIYIYSFPRFHHIWLFPAAKIQLA